MYDEQWEFFSNTVNVIVPSKLGNCLTYYIYGRIRIVSRCEMEGHVQST